MMQNILGRRHEDAVGFKHEVSAEPTRNPSKSVPVWTAVIAISDRTFGYLKNLYPTAIETGTRLPAGKYFADLQKFAT